MIAKNLGKARHTDAMRVEIFKNIFHSIAEEMGAALRRSAFSANIKERRDYSCAVYDGNGEVLAMGDHMPVHLGSMPASVAAARAALPFEPGDIALLNGIARVLVEENLIDQDYIGRHTEGFDELSAFLKANRAAPVAANLLKETLAVFVAGPPRVVFRPQAACF